MLWHRWHPETCLDQSDFATLIRDPIRQAIAETFIGAACPQVSMAPVLAITSMVAGTVLRVEGKKVFEFTNCYRSVKDIHNAGIEEIAGFIDGPWVQELADLTKEHEKRALDQYNTAAAAAQIVEEREQRQRFGF